MTLKEFLVLFMICTVWGLHFIVIKLAVGESIPPVFYAATRVTLVTLLTLPWLRWHKGQMLWLILGGLGFAGFNYLFIFQGLEMTTAAAGAVTIELYVPFSILLSVIFFKEKVGLWRSLGVIMAFCGVVIVATAKPGEAAGPLYFLGIIFLMCAALSEAIGALIVKRLKNIAPLELLSWFTLVGACLLWPASFIIEDNQFRVFSADIRWNFAAAVLYSALLASILAHGSYYWLLKRLPLHIVAPSGLMMTVITVAGAALILKEPLTPRLIGGAILTLSGIGVILFRNKQRADDTEIL
ncbi:DMT family transporter [Litorimonas sp.]|jgi:O-acetylserine/cysteine efflux transporter|uniref:DMT family transporter n=1 Tax=Litorimonas sp. TaxID=1892381 RepID=UPI003A8C00AC